MKLSSLCCIDGQVKGMLGEKPTFLSCIHSELLYITNPHLNYPLICVTLTLIANNVAVYQPALSID